MEPHLFFILLSLLVIFPLPGHSCIGQRICEFRAFCCLLFLVLFRLLSSTIFFHFLLSLLLLCLLLPASVSSWPCFIQTCGFQQADFCLRALAELLSCSHSRPRPRSTGRLGTEGGINWC